MKKIAAAVAAGFAALTIAPGIAGASVKRAELPRPALTIDVPSVGGRDIGWLGVQSVDQSLQVIATVRDARLCAFTARPALPGFDGRRRCVAAGRRLARVERVARIPVNRSHRARRYVLTVVAVGPSRRTVRRLVIDEAGAPVARRAGVLPTPGPPTPPVPTVATPSQPAPSWRPPTPTVDWVHAGEQLGTFGNTGSQGVASCTLAAVADWEAIEAHSGPLDPTPFIDEYDALVQADGGTPGPDSGVSVDQALTAWSTAPGIDGETISSYEQVGTSQSAIEAALGSAPVIVSLVLPAPAYEAAGVDDGWITPSWTTASPPGGYVGPVGHTALAVGYDNSTDSVVLATWGSQLEVSFAEFEALVNGAWTVTLGPPVPPPIISTTMSSMVPAQVGVPFEATLSADEPVTWSVNGLPPGLALTVDADGTAVVSGTPTQELEAGAGVTATAANGDATTVDVTFVVASAAEQGVIQ